MRTLLLPLFPLVAVAVAGCSSEVAVSPRGSMIASSKKNLITRSETMTMDVAGNVQSLFAATNTALDKLKYFRVGQDTSKKDSASVYARGLQDVYVEVNIAPSQLAGKVTVSVTLDSGSIPDTQAILAEIVGAK